MEISHGFTTKMLCQQINVHIVQRGNLITLGQLRLERLQVSQVGNRFNCRAVAEQITTWPHARGLLPIQTGT